MKLRMWIESLETGDVVSRKRGGHDVIKNKKEGGYSKLEVDIYIYTYIYIYIYLYAADMTSNLNHP